MIKVITTAVLATALLLNLSACGEKPAGMSAGASTDAKTSADASADASLAREKSQSLSKSADRGESLPVIQVISMSGNDLLRGMAIDEKFFRYDLLFDILKGNFVSPSTPMMWCLGNTNTSRDAFLAYIDKDIDPLKFDYDVFPFSEVSRVAATGKPDEQYNKLLDGLTAARRAPIGVALAGERRACQRTGFILTAIRQSTLPFNGMAREVGFDLKKAREFVMPLAITAHIANQFINEMLKESGFKKLLTRADAQKTVFNSAARIAQDEERFFAVIDKALAGASDEKFSVNWSGSQKTPIEFILDDRVYNIGPDGTAISRAGQVWFGAGDTVSGIKHTITIAESDTQQITRKSSISTGSKDSASGSAGASVK